MGASVDLIHLDSESITAASPRAAGAAPIANVVPRI